MKIAIDILGTIALISFIWCIRYGLFLGPIKWFILFEVNGNILVWWLDYKINAKGDLK